MEERAVTLSPHELGRWGEDRACKHLRARGWTILARNYRFGRREVDVVARRGPLVAFVEVKTRAGRGFGAPLEAVTRLKRREIEAVAAHFVARHGLDDAEIRFDAVSVLLAPGLGGVLIRHVEDAWRPGWD